MSRDEFMREFLRCVSREGKIDLPPEILDGRAEFLFALHGALHGKLTPKELNQAYIILARLLLGKYPRLQQLCHLVTEYECPMSQWSICLKLRAN